MENSWKKPQDYTNKVPSAMHNLSGMKSTTMFQGLNYPIRFDKVMAGDRWCFDMADLLQSDPMLGPVKGAYRLTLSVWFESDFNLYGWMRENTQQTTSEILTNSKHCFSVPAIPTSLGQSYSVADISFSDDSVQIGDDVNDLTSTFKAGLVDYRDPSVAGPLVIDPSAHTVFRPGVVGRGGLLDFIGIAPGYQGVPSEDTYDAFNNSFCADYILAYLDIMRCGFMNTQTRYRDSSTGVLTNTSFIPIVGNRSSIDYLSSGPQSLSGASSNIFDYLTADDLDGFFRWLRNADDGVNFGFDSTVLYQGNQSLSLRDNPYARGTDSYWIWFFSKIVTYSMLSSGGLCAAQYRPDVYRNLLSVDVGKTKSYVTTSNGQFSIDTLRFQNKLQRVIDRYDISGGRISSWLRTLWGVETRRNFSTPELLGVVSHVMDARTITAVSQTGEIGGASSTDVGTMRGNFDDAKRHKTLSFVASEPGTVVVIAQLVPIVSYSQNIDPALRRLNFADDYNPEFAQLGYQDVPISDYTALPTSSAAEYDLGSYTMDIENLSSDWKESVDVLDEVVGRNIAFVHLMTSTNRTHGEFSNLGSRDYWVNQRRYTRYFTKPFDYQSVRLDTDDSIYLYDGRKTGYTFGARTMISPYVDPLDFQYPFASQTLFDPHWYLDVWIDAKVTRKIGKRFMPNLERND